MRSGLTTRFGNVLLVTIVAARAVTDGGDRTSARNANLLSRMLRTVWLHLWWPYMALCVSGAVSACSQVRVSFSVRVLLVCASLSITTHRGVALIIVDVPLVVLRCSSVLRCEVHRSSDLLLHSSDFDKGSHQSPLQLPSASAIARWLSTNIHQGRTFFQA